MIIVKKALSFALISLSLVCNSEKVESHKYPRETIVKKVLAKWPSVDTYQVSPEFGSRDAWLNHLLTVMAIDAEPGTPLKTALNIVLVELADDYNSHGDVGKGLIELMSQTLGLAEREWKGVVPTKKAIADLANYFQNHIQAIGLSVPELRLGHDDDMQDVGYNMEEAQSIEQCSDNDAQTRELFEAIRNNNKLNFVPSFTPNERYTWMKLVNCIATSFINRALQAAIVPTPSPTERICLLSLLRMSYLLKHAHYIKKRHLRSLQALCDFAFAMNSYSGNVQLPSTLLDSLNGFKSEWQDKVKIDDLVTMGNQIIADETLCYNFLLHLEDLFSQLNVLGLSGTGKVGYSGAFVLKNLIQFEQVRSFLTKRGITNLDVLSNGLEKFVEITAYKTIEPAVNCELANVQAGAIEYRIVENDIVALMSKDTASQLYYVTNELLAQRNDLVQCLLRLKNEKRLQYMSASDVSKLYAIRAYFEERINAFEASEQGPSRRRDEHSLSLKSYQVEMLLSFISTIKGDFHKNYFNEQNSWAFSQFEALIHKAQYAPEIKLTDELKQLLIWAHGLLGMYIQRVTNSPQLFNLITDKLNVPTTKETILHVIIHTQITLTNLTYNDAVKLRFNREEAKAVGIPVDGKKMVEIETTSKEAKRFTSDLTNYALTLERQEPPICKPPSMDPHSFIGFLKSFKLDGKKISKPQLEALIQALLILPALLDMPESKITRETIDVRAAATVKRLQELLYQQSKTVQNTPKIFYHIELEPWEIRLFGNIIKELDFSSQNVKYAVCYYEQKFIQTSCFASPDFGLAEELNRKKGETGTFWPAIEACKQYGWREVKKADWAN